MAFREVLAQSVNALFWVVDIVSSTLGDLNEVDLKIGNEQDNSDPMPAEMWTQAGIAVRPKDGDDTLGHAKVIKIQYGETSYVISTFDPRHVEACQLGEVVIYALGKDGTNRSLVRLKPDGTVEIEGDVVHVCGSSDAAALASKLDALAHDVATHVHAGVTSGVSSTGTAGTLTSYGALAGWSAASSKLKVGG